MRNSLQTSALQLLDSWDVFSTQPVLSCASRCQPPTEHWGQGPTVDKLCGSWSRPPACKSRRWIGKVLPWRAWERILDPGINVGTCIMIIKKDIITSRDVMRYVAGSKLDEDQWWMYRTQKFCLWFFNLDPPWQSETAGGTTTPPRETKAL